MSSIHPRFLTYFFAIAAALLAPHACQAAGAARGADPARSDARTPAVSGKRVREPAVAGLFYPKDEAGLSRMIEGLLSAAHPEPVADLKAIICPHAGYPYSGPTAAFSYRLLVGREFRKVLVLAPSHYASFAGASVSAADSFRTPLGVVPIWEGGRELAKTKPFVLETSCFVERPSWAESSSRKAPAPAEDTPDTWEHADEVQIPFLQKTLRNFKVLPIIFGQVDPEQAGRVLAEKLDADTLIVASSDLSHYHPYAQARELDTRCVKAICNVDVESTRNQEACGKIPILTLLHIARLKGWKARLLDYRNSGDTAGDRSRVVGYSAIAFFAPGQEVYTPPERRLMIDLARRSIQAAVMNQSVPEVKTDSLAKKFFEPKGCFVTLTEEGKLRGCIGHIIPQEPLYLAIQDNARSAATHDPRFRPVQRDELPKIEIEISVLTEPQALRFTSSEDLLNKLTPYKDGVVLHIGPRSATYLPQVWVQIPDKVGFLNSLSEKAGCLPGAWRDSGTTVSTYQVECFKETE